VSDAKKTKQLPPQTAKFFWASQIGQYRSILIG
jgi:hypothetical protein